MQDFTEQIGPGSEQFSLMQIAQLTAYVKTLATNTGTPAGAPGTGGGTGGAPAPGATPQTAGH